MPKNVGYGSGGKASVSKGRKPKKSKVKRGK